MAGHPGGWEAAQRSQAASAAVDDRVQSPQAEGEAIRQGLLTSRRQLSLLRRQLLAMQREAARQQQLVETLLMEKECELRLARAEAEAHRTAGRARSAVVATLQSAAAVLQQDKAALQARVQRAEQEAAAWQHLDAPELEQLWAAVQAKPAALHETQLAAGGAAELAQRLGSMVGLVECQLADAQQQANSLACENQQLCQAAEALSGEAAQLAGRLREELAEQRAENEGLRVRVQVAEADASAAASQAVAACDDSAALAQRVAELQAQVEHLNTQSDSSSSGDQEALAQALCQLEAEKAALQQEVVRLQAESASLHRLVRTMRQQPASPGCDPALSGQQLAGEDDCGEAGSSHDRGLEPGPQAARAAAAAGRVAAACSPARNSLHAEDSGREAFLEEQVQSLSAAVQRLQQQNRQLRSGAGEQESTGQQQQELGMLRAENSALRRGLRQAEEEASEAQQEVCRLKLEAQGLLAEVAQAVTTLSSAGLAPPAVSASSKGPPLALEHVATRPGHGSPVAFASTPLGGRQLLQPAHDVPITPPSAAQAGHAGRRTSSDGSEVLVAELQQAMAAMDSTPASSRTRATDSSVMANGGGLAALAADMQALQELNAQLQRDIDCISAMGSVQATPCAAPVDGYSTQAGQGGRCPVDTNSSCLAHLMPLFD